MEIPKITKITLNMGVGEAVADRKVMEHAVGDMTKIAGQKPIVIKARKSVAGFKLREGSLIVGYAGRGQGKHKFQLSDVTTIDGKAPGEWGNLVAFIELDAMKT